MRKKGKKRKLDELSKDEKRVAKMIYPYSYYVIYTIILFITGSMLFFISIHNFLNENWSLGSMSVFILSLFLFFITFGGINLIISYRRVMR